MTPPVDLRRETQALADLVFEGIADSMSALSDHYQQAAVEAHMLGDWDTEMFARGGVDATQRIARNLKEIAARTKEV